MFLIFFNTILFSIIKILSYLRNCNVLFIKVYTIKCHRHVINPVSVRTSLSDNRFFNVVVLLQFWGPGGHKCVGTRLPVPGPRGPCVAADTGPDVGDAGRRNSCAANRGRLLLQHITHARAHAALCQRSASHVVLRPLTLLPKLDAKPDLTKILCQFDIEQIGCDTLYPILSIKHSRII